MLAWYRHLRMTPKIVLPVTIVLVVTLSLLTWQIQSKSSQAIEEVAKRELAALGAQNGNFVMSYLNTALSEAAAMAEAARAVSDLAAQAHSLTELIEAMKKA